MMYTATPAPAQLHRVSAAFDLPLVLAASLLLGIGLVMVASASLEIASSLFGNSYHFFIRQLIFAGLGLIAAVVMAMIPLEKWEAAGPWLLLLIIALLVAVHVPGLGRTVNGATRWIPLGIFNLQVSEPVKVLAILYLAGYIVRHYSNLRLHFMGFLRPLVVLGLGTVLLVMQPDFGAAVILLLLGMGMLFLAGARLWQFVSLLGTVVVLMSVIAVATPYRVARLTAFVDPWQDPYNSGFQLTQSLIAIGSGGWFGAGLGGSVQKLFYLPEAHNDFLFAVYAEEFGFVGVVLLLALFAVLIWRIFLVGIRAERAGHAFGSHVAYGIGLWLAIQSGINVAVNMGLLPTKGLTLPLLSYGGSSLIITLAALGLLYRISWESQVPRVQPRRVAL
jgi:cell division protein FtsW